VNYIFLFYVELINKCSNYPGLFLNDEDIKQYVQTVINEISKKDANNKFNNKNS
jgi:hypothetical protein